MKRHGFWILATLALWSLPASSAPSSLPFGKFGDVAIYGPGTEPAAVVIFLSGDEGWHLGVMSMAQNLAKQGALVLGVDTRHYLGELARGKSACHSLAGDLETLSHGLQKQLGLREYHVPILIGYSSGATVAYATLAEAPIGTFTGAISLGFCADQDFHSAPLCPGVGLHYNANARGDYVLKPTNAIRDPWIVLQGQQDLICNANVVNSFVAAVPGASVIPLPSVGHGFGVERNWMPQLLGSYQRLAAKAQPVILAAPDVNDLPLTLVPTTVSGGHAMTLLLTGDGGWAGIDQELSGALSRRGIPVVGLNTLKYFWKKRSPEELAAAATRVLRHYLAEWRRERIVLVGYSFGADVLPFVVNGLPKDLRDRVSSVSLLGLSEYASFEVHVADWIPGIRSRDAPVLPEIAKMRDLNILCIYGEGESDTLCPQLASSGVKSLRVGKGHHFSGGYDVIADAILRLP